MYEVVSITTGIGLYFLATRESTPAALAILGGTAVVCMAGVSTGFCLRFRRPKVAAAAPWFWSVLLMAVGAGIAWLVIALSASLITSATDHNKPVVEAVGLALDVALAITVAKTAQLTERIGLKWATMQLLVLRADERSDDFPLQAALDDPRRLAYQAVRDDKFNTGSEVVDGWGFRARKRRFEFVASIVRREDEAKPRAEQVPPSVTPPPAADDPPTKRVPR
jgi:hypothetical protein